MEEPSVWDDHKRAGNLGRQINRIKNKISRYTELESFIKDNIEFALLAQEEGEMNLLDELVETAARVSTMVRDFELETLLSEVYDSRDAIVTLHAGAGGTEAMDWVGILYRMYSRWIERKGFEMETLDILPGDEAGLKNVNFSVKGDYAYGFLRTEKGVHRLVRISPFDSSRRRHTSFASVDVVPEIQEDTEIELKPEELKIDTFRASGAGGQHVNVTDSAVRITHIPTGVVVSCQNERSQHSNRLVATRMLKAKLLALKEEERQRQLDALRGTHKEIAWGSQIRSYVFQPYTMVKDHRTGLEIGNTDRVMDGDIDDFIYAKLRQDALA